MHAIEGVLDRNWLTNDGPLLQELEHRLGELLEVPHCVVVANGTMALDLAIRALDLSGEVIVPSFTFIATAHALQWRGIRPVFCDIDPETLCLDPAQAERLINEKTTAIMGVHVYGRPCDTDELNRIAQHHGLRLLYDAAHALACGHKDRMIGAFGDCEVFSFHATKVLNTLEGGAITTADDELAASLRRLRNFGFPGDGRDTTEECGINAKMNEICAAVGLNNLEALEEIIATNRAVYHRYRDCLEDARGVELVQYDERQANNFQYVVIRVDESGYGASRDELANALAEHGVLARRYFAPGCHAMQPYAALEPKASLRLPVTCRVSREALALPTGPQMAPGDIEFICRFIREFPVAGKTTSANVPGKP